MLYLRLYFLSVRRYLYRLLQGENCSYVMFQIMLEKGDDYWSTKYTMNYKVLPSITVLSKFKASIFAPFASLETSPY